MNTINHNTGCGHVSLSGFLDVSGNFKVSSNEISFDPNIKKALKNSGICVLDVMVQDTGGKVILDVPVYGRLSLHLKPHLIQ